MATHSSVLARTNPMDREAWWATVHGAQSRMGLNRHACATVLMNQSVSLSRFWVLGRQTEPLLS